MIRSRSIIAAIAAGSLLAACSTVGLNTTHAKAERLENDAELLFQATVAAMDADVAAGKMSPATHDADKLSAWQALQIVRTAYNAGQAINLAVLQADAAKAKAVQ